MSDDDLYSRLTLLSRDYCHLCHDMITALELLQAGRGFHLDVLDVDAYPDLVEKYDQLVPVLLGDGKEICHYFLDVAALDAYLAKVR
ncbi:MAG: glutaredoxin family protein [Burkholderiales bacterium]